jgi:hypothetical protein
MINRGKLHFLSHCLHRRAGEADFVGFSNLMRRRAHRATRTLPIRRAKHCGGE